MLLKPECIYASIALCTVTCVLLESYHAMPTLVTMIIRFVIFAYVAQQSALLTIVFCKYFLTLYTLV